MKRLASTVVMLALTSCAAEVSAPEEVGASPEAVVATVPTTVVAPGTIPPFEPEPTEPTLDIPGVPTWKAYIAAPKGHHARYGAASARPDLVDEHAYIVLVRQGEHGLPDTRFPLFYRQAWLYGDRFFERLSSEMKLTPLDWVGIQMAIVDLEEHPVLLPRSLSAYRRLTTFEDGGGGPTIPPPPPLPGDDHQGPAPSGGGHPTGGGTEPTPPHPPPPEPDYTSPPPLPPAPPGCEHLAQNGVYPDDLSHGSFPPGRPEDASYTPDPGEEKELIRCEGSVYFAYKANCIDFQSATPGIKWIAKTSNWIGKSTGAAWDSMREYIHHNVWHDGKNPECSEAAYEWGETFCASEGLAFFGVCAAFPACYAAVVSGGMFSVAAGFAAGGPGLGKCSRAYAKAVIERICVH